MKSVSKNRNNPYRGPVPYERDDGLLLEGRDQEARKLISLTISEGFVLFYAQSGAGKSSLINKAVIPGLEFEGCGVLPVARVGLDLPPNVKPSDLANVYVFNVLRSWSSEGIDLRTLYALTIDEFLTGLDDPRQQARLDKKTFKTGPLGTVIVLDRFEEILTSHERYWQQRWNFFDQLAKAIEKHPTLSLILVSREDAVPGLERFTNMVSRFSRFHMDPLSYDMALEAIKVPVEKAGVPFEPGVAELIATDLSQRRLDDGTRIKGEFVDPVHLQVVCFQLWEEVSRLGATKITQSEVKLFGNVDEALKKFYTDGISQVAKKTETNVGSIALWFEEKLTRSGKPWQATGGLPPVVISALVDAYLVRATKLGDETIYQLAHDRLLEPILAANRSLIPRIGSLRLASRRWDKSNRDKSFLIRGRSLKEVQVWAKDHHRELRETERDFLQASEKAENDRRTIKLVSMSVGALLAIAVLLFIVARLAHQTQTMKVQNAHLLSTEAAIFSNSAQQKDPSLSLLLALHSASLSYPFQKDLFPEVKNALNIAVRGSRLKLVIPDLKDEIKQVIYDPKGTHIASVQGKTVYVWNASTGELVKEFIQESEVSAAAFSPDGKYLAVSAENGIAKLLNLRDDVNNKVSPQTFNHGADINSVVFSPDGSLLVTGGGDGKAMAWNLKTKRLAFPLPHGFHNSAVNSVAFSPDGAIIATAGDDHTAKIWSARTGNRLGLFEHKASVNFVSFSANSRLLATASADQTAKFWNVSTGAQIAVLPHSAAVEAVLFGKSEQFAFTADADGKITVWYLQNPFGFGSIFDLSERIPSPKGSLLFTQLLPLVAHTGAVLSMAVSPNGDWLASAGHDKTIRIWSIASIPKSPINDVTLSPDGHLLAVASSDGVSVRTFDSGAELYSRPFLSAKRVLFTRDGRFLWVADLMGIYRLNANVGTVIERHGCLFCRSIALRSDGQEVVSADLIHLAFWSKGSLNAPVTSNVGGSQSDISQIAFNSSGHLLAEAFLNGSIGIVDAATHKTLLTLPPTGSQIVALVFHPREENVLATGGQDHKIRFWNAETGQLIRELGGHSAQISSLAFSADGSELASGGADGTVKLWATSTGTSVATITGHTDEVRGLTFSPDGRLVSGSLDKTIQVYDSDSRRLLREGWAQVRRPLTSEECDTFLPSEPCPPEFQIFVEGIKLAQTGQLSEAAVKFAEVEKVNKTLVIEPRELATDFRVQYFIETANLSAVDGDIDGALDLLSKVRDLDTVRVNSAIDDLAKSSEVLLKRGIAQPLLTLANRGKEIDPNFSLSVGTWNDLCWYGSLFGLAGKVIFACDNAVTQSGGDPTYRDSRGVALALNGRLKDAIPDFQAFATVADPSKKRTRQQWIASLQRGKNPLTSMAREELLKQSGVVQPNGNQ